MAWTVCWVNDEGKDVWDRFENAHGVHDYLDRIRRHDALEDTLIFPHDTGLSVEEFITLYNSKPKGVDNGGPGTTK